MFSFLASCELSPNIEERPLYEKRFESLSTIGDQVVYFHLPQAMRLAKIHKKKLIIISLSYTDIEGFRPYTDNFFSDVHENPKDYVNAIICFILTEEVSEALEEHWVVQGSDTLKCMGEVSRFNLNTTLPNLKYRNRILVVYDPNSGTLDYELTSINSSNAENEMIKFKNAL